LPSIDDALIVTPDQGPPIMAEVRSHLDEATVRAIALESTEGLRGGVAVRSAGGPLEVPVGEAARPLARFDRCCWRQGQDAAGRRSTPADPSQPATAEGAKRRDRSVFDRDQGYRSI